MKKLFNVSDNIATILENYAYQNGVTQSALVETSLSLYFSKVLPKNELKIQITKPARGQLGLFQAGQK